MHYRVAIDGPSGAGKSSIAKSVAKELGILYVDTGALYRAVAYIARENKLEDDIPNLLEVLKKYQLTFKSGQITVNGKNVESKIRSEEISKLSSRLSKEEEIRRILLGIQQKIAREHSLVMEGRDIGSVVIPDAEFKFYLTADAKIRSERRYQQLIEKGEDADFESVYKEMVERDFRDKNRAHAPLVMVEDAICIDSGNMSEEDVLRRIVDIIRESQDVL